MLALSLYWFLYLGALGLFLPYFSLYLSESAGLGATEIGVVVTMPPLVALVAPTLWGHFADHARSRVWVLAIATIGAAASCALLGELRGFTRIAAGTALFAVFSSGVIPITVSVTLAALGDEGLYGFGRIRVWGTIGFLVAVVSFPPLLHAVEPASGLGAIFPSAAALTMASACVLPFLADGDDRATQAPAGEWRELTRHRPFVRMLFYLFATFLFLQGPMSLFPVYVRAHGSGLDALSRMWILMLALEIPLIAFSGAGLRTLGSRGLIAGGVAAGGIRWLLCGFVAEPWVVYAAQLMHGVTVAGLGIGSSLYIEASVPRRLRSTGQGLGSMAGVGVGSMVSNVAAGWLIDEAGVDAPFRIGGAGALVLAALVTLILPLPSREASKNTP